jgi:hypothetical protein
MNGDWGSQNVACFPFCRAGSWMTITWYFADSLSAVKRTIVSLPLCMLYWAMLRARNIEIVGVHHPYSCHLVLGYPEFLGSGGAK